MAFYIYENWQAGPRRTMIHTGSCGYCKNGEGKDGEYDPNHAKWHGPFKLISEAYLFVAAIKDSTENKECSRCIKVITNTFNGSHDKYGKFLLDKVVGNDFKSKGKTVKVNYNAGSPARIDGTIKNLIAVEVESRTSKQVRGAVLDLILHKYPKKLLVLLPVHMNNPMITAKQCEFAFSKFVDDSNYMVIILKGDGSNPMINEDLLILEKAIKKLSNEC